MIPKLCGWCGRPIPERAGPGRPRRWCKHGCRQQAHMARKLADAHGLGADDVVISRGTLDELQGHLYVLQAALEDVERDLSGKPTARDVAEALAWLKSSAEPLAQFWVEPRASA